MFFVHRRLNLGDRTLLIIDRIGRLNQSTLDDAAHVHFLSKSRMGWPSGSLSSATTPASARRGPSTLTPRSRSAVQRAASSSVLKTSRGSALASGERAPSLS